MSNNEDRAATATLRGQFPTTPAGGPLMCRRERVVAWLAGAAMILPAWLMGGWELWSQWVTLALAALAWIALFVPVFDYRAWPPSPRGTVNFRRLLKFPIFWLGLAVLLYGAVAALNPWQALTSDGTRAWLDPLVHVRWLPHSLVSPFWDMDAWRALLVIAPGWLVTCAIWVGVESPQLLRRLLKAVAISGFVLAVFGIVERENGTRDMFWLYNPRPLFDEPVFFGSFIYAGHAAAWLLLAFGAAIALLEQSLQGTNPETGPRWWHQAQFRQTGWTAAALILAIALGGYTRPDFWVLGAVGILLIWVLAKLGRGADRLGRKGSPGPGNTRVVVPVALFAGLVLVGWWTQSSSISRLSMDLNPRDPTLAVRVEIAKTSADMIFDEPLWGWGPGSYRHVAGQYLKRNPLFTVPGHPEVLRYRANHAHSDWVQLAGEWGLAGAALLLVMFGWWLAKAWQWRAVLPVETWCVLGAAGLLLVGALVDFPLYNPAVLAALGGLLAAAMKPGEQATRQRAWVAGWGEAETK